MNAQIKPEALEEGQTAEVSKALKALNVTEQSLAGLEDKFKGFTVPETKKDESYLFLKDGIKELRGLWVTVDKRGKELKADALAWQRLINGEVTNVTGRLKSIAEPMVAAKKFVDDEAERVAEAARLKEEQRIQAIENKITGISAFGEKLITCELSVLVERLARLSNIVIDELYGEFQEAAKLKLGAVMVLVETAINDKKLYLQQQETLKKQQEEIAEVQRLQAVEDKKRADCLQAEEDKLNEMRKEMADIQRVKDEEAKLEAQKIDDANKLLDAAAELQRQEREKEIAATIAFNMPNDESTDDYLLRQYADDIQVKIQDIPLIIDLKLNKKALAIQARMLKAVDAIYALIPEVEEDAA